MNRIEIDGSLGEGGGQIFRTSITLSLLTKIPTRIFNIRARRSSPGLKHQHLTALEAACQISNAHVSGNRLGSQDVSFTPGEIKSGNYQYKIPTAGSAGLVLQTIFVPLSFATGTSQILINGGTHVPWSPQYHYLELQWIPWLTKMGYKGSLRLDNCGYFPAGGGQLACKIMPSIEITPIKIRERGKLVQISGISGVSNLTQEIAKRQRQRLVNKLGSTYPLNDIRSSTFPAKGKGTFIVLLLEYENSTACVSTLGEKGKRAEDVADEVVEQVENLDKSKGCMDRFLADQLLIPLCFSTELSSFYTSQVTHHLLTNAKVIQQFLPLKISVAGELGKSGLVTINPAL